MERDYNDTFIRSLFDNIAKYDPILICERKASKYVRQYYKYKDIKITVTKEVISREIMSITVTKF